MSIAAQSSGTRLAGLHVLRLVLAGALLSIVAVAPDTVGLQLVAIAPYVAAYLLCAVTVEVLRQRGGLPVRLLDAVLLVDGLALAAVVGATGGPASVLGFALPVQIVAVTLLVSYRTGLKLALWQSVLLIAAASVPLATWAATPTATAFAITGYLAVAAVTALCSSVNERHLERSRAASQALAAMTRRLQTIAAPEEALGVLVAAVTEDLGFPRAAVLPHATGGALVRRTADGTRAVLLASADPVDDADVETALPGARNLVAVPLTSDGSPFAVLVAERGGSGAVRLSAATPILLGQFATAAALAHRNARLVAEIQRLATTDQLTGLANRRTFDEALHREVARSRRSGVPLTLLLLDVDHFKAVNDTHGHPAGDAVLRCVGRGLAARARESDLPARYGGEEFAVLLPDCSADEAFAVADRLRTGITTEDSPVAVTASAGYATFGRDATDESGLIAAADAALYHAKSSGRDRTVGAGTAAVAAA